MGCLFSLINAASLACERRNSQVWSWSYDVHFVEKQVYSGAFHARSFQTLSHERRRSRSKNYARFWPETSTKNDTLSGFSRWRQRLLPAAEE